MPKKVFYTSAKPTREDQQNKSLATINILESLMGMAKKLHPTTDKFNVSIAGSSSDKPTLDKAVDEIIASVSANIQLITRDITEGREPRIPTRKQRYENALKPLLEVSVIIGEAISVEGGGLRDFATFNEAMDQLGQSRVNLTAYEDEIVQCFDDWANAVEANIASEDIKMPLAPEHQKSVDIRADKTRIRGVFDLLTQTDDGFKTNTFIKFPSIVMNNHSVLEPNITL